MFFANMSFVYLRRVCKTKAWALKRFCHPLCYHGGAVATQHEGVEKRERLAFNFNQKVVACCGPCILSAWVLNFVKSVGGPTLQGPGKISWTEKDIQDLALEIKQSLPLSVTQVLTSPEWAGGRLLQLESEVSRPTANDLVLNY